MLALLLLLGAGRALAVTSDTFTVAGQVNHSPTFSYSTSPLPLLGLPVFTETNLAVAGAYTGVSLESLLTNNAIGITPDPTQAKNSIIGEYVVAVGSDGYRVVYSGGELDSGFGGSNTLRPDLLATNSTTRPSAPTARSAPSCPATPTRAVATFPT
jgi:hypothetical protein